MAMSDTRQKGSEQVRGHCGNEHEPVYHELKVRDDGYCPKVAPVPHMMAKIIWFLGLLPQPCPHQAARSNGSSP